VILYGYPLSSASYRVRIALALKNVDVTTVNKRLREGEHRQADYLRLNSQGFVPALELDDGEVLTQSMAIIEYLEETYPDPPLLPRDAAARAHVRALCQLIACDVHPLNNLRVLQYLEGPLGLPRDARDAWYRHWVSEGFTALERTLARGGAGRAGAYCCGDGVSMADVCLVPQVFNARRFEVDLTAFPSIVKIDAACRELAAFAGAAPAMQG
jgi:maleylpyruvate isomerase